MGRTSLMSELMAEDLVYGGCLATREEVYRDALRQTGSARAADRFAFAPEAATEQEKACLPRLADVLPKLEREKRQRRMRARRERMASVPE